MKTENYTATTSGIEAQSIEFMPIRNYIRIVVEANGPQNFTSPTEAYFDNFRILDGTTEEMIDGGIANKLAFKYRIHDARIGRFLSRDQLAKEFAWNSPYAFSENRVVDAIELEGAESLIVHEKINLTKSGKSETQKVQTWKQAYPDSEDEHGPRGTG